MAATAVVWEEDFESYEVGTTSGSAKDLNGMDVGWNTYENMCADWFEVRENPDTGSKWMEARDLDGNGYWITDRILVGDYDSVDVSIDIGEYGPMEWTDYMLFFYSMTDTADEERNWELFSYQFNDFGSATAEVSGISGNYLSLGVVIRNNRNNEIHGFDNVRVTTLSTPVPTSLLLLGSGILGLAGFRRRMKKH